MSLLPPVSKWHGAADVKLGKLSGASGGVADAQTFSFPTPPTQSWWGNCSHGPQQPLTERAPVPTSAGNIQRTATRPSKTASLPPHHIQLLYPWLGITFPRRRHQSSFVISSAHFPPGSSCDIRRNQAKSERATYPWRPTSCPPTHLPNFDPDLWTRARDTNVPVDTNVIAPTRDLHQARRQLQIPTLNTLPDCDQPSPHSPSATSQLPGWIQTWRTLGACPPS
jgi:hypothetical protein